MFYNYIFIYYDNVDGDNDDNGHDDNDKGHLDIF